MEYDLSIKAFIVIDKYCEGSSSAKKTSDLVGICPMVDPEDKGVQLFMLVPCALSCEAVQF